MKSSRKKCIDNIYSRREIIKVAAIGVGVATTSSLPIFAQQTRARLRPRNPLKLLKTVSAKNRIMIAASGVSDLGGGHSSNVLAYRTFPGPTLIARRGDNLNIKLSNKLDEETIIHWHGMVVDSPNDGGPQDAIMPGETYNYNFTINQRAALNWYHPHPHMMTGGQVNLGLAGAFIVRDDEEDALNLPKGKYEIPLIIRDANFDENGDLLYNPDMLGFFGDTPLVNGTIMPTHPVDRGVYRFRILSSANARVFRLALSNGAAFTLIGNDGGLLATPTALTEITIGAGERLDVLVNFEALGAGSTVMLRNLSAGWDLLEFVGTGANGIIYSPPTNLSIINSLDGPTEPTRTFEFFGHNLINGQSFEMDRIDFSVPIGETERWRFISATAGPHPIHVHGASFQVVSRTGGRNQVFAWERGWKDTVLLNTQETVDVLIRFDHYRGRYLLHCHNLEHEDMGMMSNFEVV